MTARRIPAVWLGRKRYADVHRLQNELQEARKDGRVGDIVLFVEHPPVITLGRKASEAHVLFPKDALRERGVEVEVTERGGEVTVHAPGQLVCYPIVDLAPDRCDVRRYVRDLTEIMRRLAADFGVSAGTIDEHIGLWVDRESVSQWPGQASAKSPAKLGAVGVHLSRWVTKHGFALNATTNLDFFAMIVPCGITTHGVTSLLDLTGRTVAVEDLAPRAHELLCDVLGAERGELMDRADAEATAALFL